MSRKNGRGMRFNKWWLLDESIIEAVYQKDAVYLTTHKFIAPSEMPICIAPKQWPDQKTIGKSMVRGWTVPCVFYPRCRGRISTFVYPGITQREAGFIHLLMNDYEEKGKEFV